MGLYFGSLLVDLLVLLTTVTVVIYAYCLWSFQYWKKRNVPYLEPSLPWGNLERPFNRTMSIGDEMVEFYKKAKARGWKYIGLYSSVQVILMVLDLDLLKRVMTKDFQYFTDRGVYTNEKDDPLSCHLFAIGGTKWRNLRTKLSPTFTSGKMKAMFSTLVDCGLVLEQYLENNIDNKEGLDIKDTLAKFSTDVIGSCAFGLECNSFKDPNSPFRIYGRKIFDRTWWEQIKFTLANTFPNLARTLGVILIPRDVSDFLKKVVKDTIAYRKTNNYTRNDFLQLLIGIMDNKDAAHDGLKGDARTMTMNEVTAQCFVFFAAGFETSSTTMTFALYEMAKHQDIQDRVRQEIKTVLARHNNQMTYDSLSEMKYLKQVIDETLRKSSAVPFVNRLCNEDYKIPGEDVVIEKGTQLTIPIQAIHTDEEYYKDPSKFDPDRFSEENKVRRHPYAHIPFGEGPRICIGERFGIMQTKVGLTSLLRNFRVTLNKKTQEPIKLSTNTFFPSIEGGLWLNLEKL